MKYIEIKVISENLFEMLECLRYILLGGGRVNISEYSYSLIRIEECFAYSRLTKKQCKLPYVLFSHNLISSTQKENYERRACLLTSA